jgi:RHS repeat-associated protein
LTNIKNANNHIVGQMTNSLGQLALVQENTGTGPHTAYSRTRYYYDVLGNLQEVHTTDGTVDGDPDPAGTETLRHVSMSYDGFGRKESMNDPDMGAWNYSYDAAGNLTQQKDANEDQICFGYDKLDRLVRKARDSNPNTDCPAPDTLPVDGEYHLASYVYDTAVNGTGQIAQVSWGPNPAQNYETFSYDSLGRAQSHTRVIDGRAYTMSTLQFDVLHRPLRIQYPAAAGNSNGEIIEIEYNREGENSLMAGTDELVESLSYNARGQLKILALGNGRTTSYTYDPQTFRLTGLVTDNGLQNLNYEYDNVGNITQMADSLTGDIQVFSYDSLNRLKTAVAPPGSSNCMLEPCYNHSYDYDELGNIRNYAGSSYGYNEVGWHQDCYDSPADQPEQPLNHAVRHIGSQYFCYDQNGNMITREDSSGSYSQAFDVENRLIRVTDNDNGEETHFGYDAHGQRLYTEKPDGAITYYPFPGYEEEVHPDEWQPVAIPASSYAGQDPPGWTMAVGSSDWTATPLFPGTSTWVGEQPYLSNLAAGAIQSPWIILANNGDDSFTIKFKFKGEIDSGSSNNQPVNVEVVMSNSFGFPAPDTVKLSPNLTFDGTWRNVMLTFEKPTGYDWLQFRFILNPTNGWGAFDDLLLLNEAGESIPMPDASFEQGGLWSEQPHPDYPATSIWRGSEGPAAAAHGQYSYLISNLGHTHLATAVPIPVSKDIQTISAELQGQVETAGGPGLHLRLVYYEPDANMELVPVGLPVTLWQASSFHNSDGAIITGSAARPATATHIDISLAGAFSNGWLAVNSVTLTEQCFDWGCPVNEKELLVEEEAWEEQWGYSLHPDFPASHVETISKSNMLLPYRLSNEANGYITSPPIHSGGSQDYTLAAQLLNQINSDLSYGHGQLRIHFHNAGDNLIASHLVWHSDNTQGSDASSDFTTPAGTAYFRVVLEAERINGGLGLQNPALSGWSQWVESGPSQYYDFSALVSGQSESEGGRIRVHYDNGGGKTLWQNSGSYDSPAGSLQNNSFTTPAGSSQFRFSYRAQLDQGWLAFSDLTLTGWSDTIAVEDGYQHLLGLHIAGELQAAQGQGGKVMVHYPNSSADPATLWQNPANFNSSGSEHSLSFTPPAGATEAQFSYMVKMDKGWLAYSEPELQWRHPGYTITRKTYALGGQTIATRISGDQEGDNGLFYIHSDHLGSTSVMSYGQGHGSNSGNKVDDSTARYLPFGDWRVEPAHDLTDQGFTGQKHNMDLGLYYYNARFYLPGIGRFASADTIVPDPSNPQQYNRYTYTLNNPLRFTDPTGHFSQDEIMASLTDQYGYSEAIRIWNLWMNDPAWMWALHYAQDGWSIWASEKGHGTFEVDGVRITGSFGSQGVDTIYGGQAKSE